MSTQKTSFQSRIELTLTHYLKTFQDLPIVTVFLQAVISELNKT